MVEELAHPAGVDLGPVDPRHVLGRGAHLGVVLRDLRDEVGAEQPQEDAHRARQRGGDLGGLPEQDLLAPRGAAAEQRHAGEAGLARPEHGGDPGPLAVADDQQRHPGGLRAGPQLCQSALALLGSFRRYLERDEVDLGRDLVGYRQVAMHLSDEELTSLLDDLREARAPAWPCPRRRGGAAGC